MEFAEALQYIPTTSIAGLPAARAGLERCSRPPPRPHGRDGRGLHPRTQSRTKLAVRVFTPQSGTGPRLVVLDTHGGFVSGNRVLSDPVNLMIASELGRSSWRWSTDSHRRLPSLDRPRAATPHNPAHTVSANLGGTPLLLDRAIASLADTRASAPGASQVQPGEGHRSSVRFSRAQSPNSFSAGSIASPASVKA